MGLIIIGTGKHSVVVYHLAISLGLEVVGFVGPKSDLKKVNEYYICSLDKLMELPSIESYDFIIAMGNNMSRKNIAKKYSLNYISLIAQNAYIVPGAKIGVGTVVMYNVIVNNNTIIGKHVLLNTGVIVEHDNTIDDYAHLSPGVTTGGTVHIGKRTHLGINSCVKNNVMITDDVTIGMGGIVVKNIDKSGIYYGNPAKYKGE